MPRHMNFKVSATIFGGSPLTSSAVSSVHVGPCWPAQSSTVVVHTSLASWASTIAADLRQDLCCLCTGILDTTGMPHPFDTNYYANTGASGPDGLLYVAQAAGGTDDSFGTLLFRSICRLTNTSNLPSLPSQCGSAHMSAAEQVCPCFAGAIVVFDTTTSSPGKYVKTFTDNTASGCGSLLHRPDYPLWAKDGRLYIKRLQGRPQCEPLCNLDRGK